MMKGSLVKILIKFLIVNITETTLLDLPAELLVEIALLSGHLDVARVFGLAEPLCQQIRMRLVGRFVAKLRDSELGIPFVLPLADDVWDEEDDGWTIEDEDLRRFQDAPSKGLYLTVHPGYEHMREHMNEGGDWEHEFLETLRCMDGKICKHLVRLGYAFHYEWYKGRVTVKYRQPAWRMESDMCQV